MNECEVCGKPGKIYKREKAVVFCKKCDLIPNKYTKRRDSVISKFQAKLDLKSIEIVKTNGVRHTQIKRNKYKSKSSTRLTDIIDKEKIIKLLNKVKSDIEHDLSKLTEE